MNELDFRSENASDSSGLDCSATMGKTQGIVL